MARARDNLLETTGELVHRPHQRCDEACSRHARRRDQLDRAESGSLLRLEGRRCRLEGRRCRDCSDERRARRPGAMRDGHRTVEGVDALDQYMLTAEPRSFADSPHRRRSRASHPESHRRGVVVCRSSIHVLDRRDQVFCAPSRTRTCNIRRSVPMRSEPSKRYQIGVFTRIWRLRSAHRVAASRAQCDG